MIPFADEYHSLSPKELWAEYERSKSGASKQRVMTVGDVEVRYDKDKGCCDIVLVGQ